MQVAGAAASDRAARSPAEGVAMGVALHAFMPYGAPDLIEGASRRMFRSTVAGVAITVVVFLVALGGFLLRPTSRTVERTVVIPYRELAAPPPLTQQAPPPQIVVAQPAAPPTMGVPVPTPDLEAPPEQTIASQQEIVEATGSVEGVAEGPLVVQAPPVEEMPKLGEFVYVDELPALVTDVAPEYPSLAREAQVEGDVLLRVLVGKDGRVAEVHVDQSIPMLDQAAIAAARGWVFKPALHNNRPVAVWIARRVRFTLKTGPA